MKDKNEESIGVQYSYNSNAKDVRIIHLGWNVKGEGLVFSLTG